MLLVLLFVLLMAAVNLAVGFALAVHLAQRFHRLTAAGEEIDTSVATSPAAATPAASRPAAGVPPWATGGGSAPASVPPWATAAPSGPPAPAESLEEESLELPSNGPPPETRSADEPLTRGNLRDGTPDEPVGREPGVGEVALRKLTESILGHHDRLRRLDGEIRTHTRSGDAEALESALGSICRATRDYLTERDTAAATVAELHRDRGEFRDLHKQFDAAFEEESRQIVYTQQTIREIDLESALNDQCRQIIAETGKLATLGHRVRDTLEGLTASVALCDDWIDEAAAALRTDRLTGLPGRIGLEGELSAWWKRDPHRMRPLAAALVEVDHYPQIEGQHGMETAAAALRSLADLLRKELEGTGSVARCGGCRFAFLFPDRQVKEVVGLVERIRQVAETTHFQSQDVEVCLTLSCGITAVSSQDTSDSLLARATAALDEARRNGGNRTYCHEGKFPTPVVPVNVALEENYVSV